MVAVGSAVFILAVALLVILQRRHLAKVQALVIGGRVTPGCVVVEAITLALIAALIVIAHYNGLL